MNKNELKRFWGLLKSMPVDVQLEYIYDIFYNCMHDITKDWDECDVKMNVIKLILKKYKKLIPKEPQVDFNINKKGD